MERELLKYIYQEDIYNLDQKTNTKKDKDESSPESDQKQIVRVLVDESYNLHKELLSKILASVNVSLDNAELIRGEKLDEFDLSAINSGKVIGFGIQLGDNLPLYKMFRQQNAFILISDSLEEIDSDSSNEKKRKLWNALKEMFS